MKQAIVIAAISRNGVYGVNGKLPWKSKLDLTSFQQKTTGNTVVMGRKTWQSLPDNKKPLPDRENIIVSRTCHSLDGAICVPSTEEALQQASRQKVFFIGGSAIWHTAMEFADEAYITVIGKDYPIIKGETSIDQKILNLQEFWPFRLIHLVHDRERVNQDDGCSRISLYRWKRK